MLAHQLLSEGWARLLAVILKFQDVEIARLIGAIVPPSPTCLDSYPYSVEREYLFVVATMNQNKKNQKCEDSDLKCCYYQKNLIAEKLKVARKQKATSALMPLDALHD